MKSDNFKILGLEFNKKQTLISLAVALGVFIVLLILNLCGVRISWYGVLIALGFMLALVFACKFARFRDLDSELPYDLIWWVFPFSIVGARLYYVIFEQIPFFWDAFRVWDGGLAIYGGIIGGAIGLIICCLIKKVSIIKTMDIVAPVLLLGQGIGRIGCYMAGCCVGNEVTNPSFQWFPISYYVHGGWHLATFFYECVLSPYENSCLQRRKGCRVKLYPVACGAFFKSRHKGKRNCPRLFCNEPEQRAFV